MKMKRKAIKTFITIGVIFLLAGFVQQKFTFNFESGLFYLGVIFTLSGIAALSMKKH